jgi:hypothetical protein
VGESVDHDVDVEDGVGIGPHSQGDGNERARWDSGKARDLHSLVVHQQVLQGIGVDSRCLGEDSAFLELECVTAELQDEGRVEVAWQKHGDGDVLHSR